MILSADWHITDIPTDEYRWMVFQHLSMMMLDTRDAELFILGDITDRKDRHSGGLVNRLVYEFKKLMEQGAAITCIMGNHDKPLQGPPFWRVLNALQGPRGSIRFYDKPMQVRNDELLLLPYADDPATAWKGYDLSDYECIFMHQLVTGVQTANGRSLENAKMPLLPRDVKIYAGDIHDPQKIGPVQYVGAPHYIKFGDRYPCRIIQLNSDYDIINELMLRPMCKHMINVSSVTELEEIATAPGDQARIRISVSLNHLDDWPAEQERIREWAEKRRVTLASIEADFLGVGQKVERKAVPNFDIDPLDAMGLLGQAEEISEPTMAYGVALLEQELKG